MSDHAADDTTELLSELRTRVEAATAQIDQLTTELTERERWVDELESMLEVVLGLTDVPVVVIGDDLRIRAVTRGASERLEGDVVGKPLSSVLPDAEFAAVVARLDEAPAATAVPTARSGTAGLRVEALPSGGAVVVLRDR